jgi:hypothetical protein
MLDVMPFVKDEDAVLQGYLPVDHTSTLIPLETSGEQPLEGKFSEDSKSNFADLKPCFFWVLTCANHLQL